MALRISRVIAAGTPFLLLGSSLMADTIQLVNGDRLKGNVAALDDKQLVLKSESFGELKIPREKIELISLGDKGIPDPQPVVVPQPPADAGSGQPLGDLNNISPLLQDPAVQRQLGPMVEQLLGPNGARDSQQNIEEARRGLHELRKDFGDGPEGKALDAYIRFFEQIAPAASLAPQKQAPAKGRRIPRAKAAEQGKSPEAKDSAEAAKPMESKKSDDAEKPAEKSTTKP